MSHEVTDPNPSALWARALCEELARAGVRHVCISPGSRSTPLALAAVVHPDLHTHVILDERAAAFFALGLARASGAPAAMLCTSGSAGAHYLPALVEASQDGVALIAITADRPVTLMGCGAPQTIDQQGMFGRFVRASLHLETPQLTPLALRHLRASIARAVALSRAAAGGQPGPVHLNAPFEEPLEPTLIPNSIPDALRADAFAYRGRADGAPALHTTHAQAQARVDPALASDLAALLLGARRPVIVCGPLPPCDATRDALIQLAQVSGAPMLAEPLSQLRAGAHSDALILTSDSFLRARGWARKHGPDVVLRFGAAPTSKAYRLWREAHPSAREVLIDPHGMMRDPVQQAESLVIAPPELLARALSDALLEATSPPQLEGAWLAHIARAEQLSREAIAASVSDATLWEGAIARDVMRLATGALFVASSMPVRDLDTFADARPEPLAIYANRGANGIDGLVSTALGIATARGTHTTALLGDLAFLHDVGGLWAASTTRAALTIVVVNNGGGGIFSYLPIAGHDPAKFERLFLTPHQVDLSALATAYGIGYEAVQTRLGLAQALERARDAGGVRVVEARVDRDDSVARHRRLWAQLSATLEQQP